ncbi:LysR family transcriptional regulator [Comamonas testosteroni]|uniref:LysR family transcriptional regulator n=1 Tax=Comamonas testosteroni TaxID=285 RepID=UPI001E3EC7F4|nr:LysR family transcriptional regulator [Comamonas testosteroni]
MHVDFRDLKYFEVIAELENIGRAAERLDKTQPALTNCVRRLEDECGAILLEKAGRGVRLTAAGHVLWKWALRARVDSESACREISNIGQGISGDVKLGMVPTVAQFLLPPAARDLLSEAPDVTLRTTVALSDVLSPLLRSGDIDLMFGTDVPSEPGLTSRLLAEDQVVVAAHSTHELFLRQRVELEDLTDYRWVLHPQGAPSRDWLDQVFTRHHLPAQIVQVESSM